MFKKLHSSRPELTQSPRSGLPAGTRSLCLCISLCAAALLAAACTAPREFPLSPAPFDSRPSKYPIDTFIGTVEESHRPISVIESYAYQTDSPETRQRQLEELRERARALGADAVQNVRLLTKQVRGYTNDTRTPFPSFRQGVYPLYFLRGDAIVYEAGLEGAAGSTRGFTQEPEGYQPEARDEAGAGQFIFRTPEDAEPGSRPGPEFGPLLQ